MGTLSHPPCPETKLTLSECAVPVLSAICYPCAVCVLPMCCPCAVHVLSVYCLCALHVLSMRCLHVVRVLCAVHVLSVCCSCAVRVLSAYCLCYMCCPRGATSDLQPRCKEVQRESCWFLPTCLCHLLVGAPALLLLQLLPPSPLPRILC